MVCRVLKPNGNFVAKVFHEEVYDQYIRAERNVFDKFDGAQA